MRTNALVHHITNYTYAVISGILEGHKRARPEGAGNSTRGADPSPFSGRSGLMTKVKSFLPNCHYSPSTIETTWTGGAA